MPARGSRSVRPGAVGGVWLSRGDPLTIREREIVELIRAGKLDKEIAELLGLSEHTVRAHIRMASARVGARTRAHLSELVRRGRFAVPRGTNDSD